MRLRLTLQLPEVLEALRPLGAAQQTLPPFPAPLSIGQRALVEPSTAPLSTLKQVLPKSPS